MATFSSFAQPYFYQCVKKVHGHAAFLVCISTMSLFAAPALSDDAKKTQFLQEYPKYSKQIAAAVSGIRGSCKVTEIRDGRQGSTNADFATGHGYTKLMLHYPPTTKIPQPIEVVLCANDQGIFSLKKVGLSGDFLVTSSGTSMAAIAQLDNRFRNLLTSPFNVFGLSLQEMIDDPKLTILSAEPLKSGADELLSLSLKFGDNPQDGVLVHLNPGKGWRIQHSEYSFGADVPGPFVYDIKYDDSTPEQLVPLVAECETPERTYKCEFIKVTREPIALAEFSMKYYQLPDLMNNSSSFNFKFWGILLVAIIGVVSLVLFLIYRKR